MLSIKELPAGFIESMKSQLGNEFDDYIRSLSEKPVSGVRINTLKTTAEEVFNIIKVDHEPIPSSKERAKRQRCTARAESPQWK